MTPTTTVLITVCGISVASNILLIGFVCYSRSLRKMTKHGLQVSMALADLMLGCLHLAQYIRRQEISPGQECYQSKRLEIIAECLGYFVVGWTVITYNLLNLLKKYLQTVARHLNSSIWAVPHWRCLSLWPWLVGLCVFVPVVLRSTSDDDLPHVDEVMCIAYLPETIAIGFSCVALHLPCYLSLAQFVTILACQCRRCHRVEPKPFAEGQIYSEVVLQEEMNILEHSAPVVTYIVCLLPFLVCTLAWFISGWTGQVSVSVTVTVFTLSRSLLQPFTWLTCEDLRDEILRILRLLSAIVSRLPRQRETSTITSVEYNAMVESQILSEL